MHRCYWTVDMVLYIHASSLFGQSTQISEGFGESKKRRLEKCGEHREFILSYVKIEPPHTQQTGKTRRVWCGVVWCGNEMHAWEEDRCKNNDDAILEVDVKTGHWHPCIHLLPSHSPVFITTSNK